MRQQLLASEGMTGTIFSMSLMGPHVQAQLNPVPRQLMQGSSCVGLA